MTFYSNEVALQTLEDDYITLLAHEIVTPLGVDTELLSLDGKQHPRVGLQDRSWPEHI